jgi:hypothetical protein
MSVLTIVYHIYYTIKALISFIFVFFLYLYIFGINDEIISWFNYIIFYMLIYDRKLLNIFF